MARTKKDRLRELIVRHGTALPPREAGMKDKEYALFVRGWRNAFAEMISAIDFEL